MINIGIIGATGYVGQQLIHLLYLHKKANIEFIVSHSKVGQCFADVYNNFKTFIDKKLIDIVDIEDNLKKIDLLFIALPHTKSGKYVSTAIKNNVKVIDLGADFRLKNSILYREWYSYNHEYENLLESSVYGLAELYRKKIKDANLVANPGCYATAGILGLFPLLKHDILKEESIIIDAKSGVSGAGKELKLQTLYSEVNESFKAYSIINHRHTPEIETILADTTTKDLKLSFCPHLIPINRGILATIYSTLKIDLSKKDIYQIFKKEYLNEKFIRLVDNPPEIKNVRNTNLCDIYITINKRTNKVIVIVSIDNLMKGAASQAIQNMNIMFNYKENEGLNLIANYL